MLLEIVSVGCLASFLLKTLGQFRTSFGHHIYSKNIYFKRHLTHHFWCKKKRIALIHCNWTFCQMMCLGTCTVISNSQDWTFTTRNLRTFGWSECTTLPDLSVKMFNLLAKCWRADLHNNSSFGASELGRVVRARSGPSRVDFLSPWKKLHIILLTPGLSWFHKFHCSVFF
jgi:hypothetical protein